MFTFILKLIDFDDILLFGMKPEIVKVTCNFTQIDDFIQERLQFCEYDYIIKVGPMVVLPRPYLYTFRRGRFLKIILDEEFVVKELPLVDIGATYPNEKFFETFGHHRSVSEKDY